LRREGHDVATLPKSLEGANDIHVPAHSHSEDRILLTHDYDFGGLAVRVEQPAVGIVIVANDTFAGTLEDLAEEVAERLAGLGAVLFGKLTVLEGGGTRQRDLPPGGSSGG
jgi:predicted nuclease of predicted toxin-antitoxin system